MADAGTANTREPVPASSAGPRSASPWTGARRRWATITGEHAWVVVGLALAALTIAEAIFVSGAIAMAAVADAIVLVLLLWGYAAGTREPDRHLLLALATLPLLRLVSMSLPSVLVPVIDWYVMIGIPVLLSVALVARTVGLRPVDLGLRLPRRRRSQLLVGASGLLLGLPAYLITRPNPLVPIPTPLLLVEAAIILGTFGAFLEELLYRGLIQSTASAFLARGGIIVSSAATALMYAASLNLRYVVFMTLVAVFFGVAVRRTGSIAGTTGAHALLLFTQLVVWPLLLG